MRMAIRRFTRLTNAFSKKLLNLKMAVSLHSVCKTFMRRFDSDPRLQSFLAVR